ncbi:MAG: diguanylate cyclase, partial [Gammaproteobacteria bacterium]
MQIKNVIYDGRTDLCDLLQSTGFTDNGRLLIQVFSGIDDPAQIGRIQILVGEYFPHAALIGATSAGEILDGRLQEKSVLFSFCQFEDTELQVVAAEATHSSALGEQIGAHFRHYPPRLLLTFANAHSVNGEDFVKGIGRLCPDMIIAGGLAGNLLLHDQGYVFNHDFISSEGAVAVALYSDSLQVQNRYSLDWVPLGKELRITHAEKNRVYTIEDIPAAEIYARYLGRGSSELLPVLGVHFPLIKAHQGTSVAHTCIAKNPDGSLDFMGNMETGTYVRFGIGDTSTMLASAAGHCRELSEWNPQGLLVFSCQARKLLMQSLVDKEIGHIHNVAPMAGFFTSGEFFSLPRGNEFFNYTLTVLALREGPARGGRQTCPEVEIEVNPVFKALTHLVNVTARELETLAGTDQLTGLCNRRSVQEQLCKALESSRRYGHPLVLIMFDVDHFKQINDSLGHHMGDLALREVTRITREMIRRTDVFGRWGGEEFLLICSETAHQGGLELAERIRHGVERGRPPALDLEAE